MIKILKKLIKDKIKDANTILFIAKSFMLRRTKMIASKLDFPMDKIKYYGLVDKEGRNISKDNWWKSEESRNRVMAEIERIGNYTNKGEISIF